MKSPVSRLVKVRWLSGNGFSRISSSPTTACRVSLISWLKTTRPAVVFECSPVSGSRNSITSCRPSAPASRAATTPGAPRKARTSP